MLIDLDTRDLVTLERDEGELFRRLEAGLRARCSQLLLSFCVVNELAGAARRGTGDGLMRLLCRLEKLPHIWIREDDLPEREVDRALVCFRSRGEYRAPQPYVRSYLDTWNPSGDDRARCASKSLAETIWDQLDEERRFGSLCLTSPIFESAIALDRNEIGLLGRRAYQQEIRSAFIRKVRRIAAERVGEDFVDLDEFAAAVWACPEWCEGARLQFEVQQVFERDAHTRPTPSDVMDLARMLHVPYVDVFTADKSKREYLSQLARSRISRVRACRYWTRCTIVADVRAAIEHLEGGRASESEVRDPG